MCADVKKNELAGKLVIKSKTMTIAVMGKSVWG
jgi:hypothetical protein